MALLAAQALLAQTSIRVQAPNVVAADEQFNVTFIIEGENAPSSFEWTTSSWSGGRSAGLRPASVS